MHYKKIVIIDVETTGLYCGEDGKKPANILRVDATKIEDGKIGETFSSLVAKVALEPLTVIPFNIPIGVVVLNILLFAGKFLAGTISHSIAITADAINNLSDAGSSFITLAGFGKEVAPLSK